MNYLHADNESALNLTEPLVETHRGFDWKTVPITGRAAMRLGTHLFEEIDGHILTEVDDKFTLEIYKIKGDGFILNLGCKQTGRRRLILEKGSESDDLSSVYQAVTGLGGRNPMAGLNSTELFNQALNEMMFVREIHVLLYGHDEEFLRG